ncbi:MAG: LysR family transcriptional regulator [Lachnospiraceae bacterium]|nr:LysR family transcriptional regulator [Lachnospiraceae bacterium]
MTFIQLKYFCEVCRWKSINKAAEQLFVTQPAVSNAIKKLEEELSTSLFMRNNNRMLLTDAGRYLYDSAVKILHEMDALEEKMLRDYANQSSCNEIKIGLPPAFASWCIDLLDEPIRKLNRKYDEKIRVALLEIHSDYLEDAFLDQKVDLLICSVDGKVPEYLGKRTIYKTSIKACMGIQNPLASRDVIRMEDLAGYPLIYSDRLEGSFIRHITQMANEAGVRLNFQYYFKRGEAIRSLLSRTNAVVFARPELSNIEGPEFVSKPMEKTIESELDILYDNRYAMRKEVVSLIEFIFSSEKVRELK